MERYKKANEGIHAPEELKKEAAKDPAPAKRPPRAVWLGAVAAVLAVVLLVGVVPRLGGKNLTGASMTEGPASDIPGGAPDPGDGLTAAPGGAVPLAAAVYPEAAPYPELSDYSDHDDFDAAFSAWMEDVYGRQKLAPAEDGLAPFYAATLPEFLGNSGGENRVYSPLNVYLALAMLAETAGGNSRQQLLDLLNAGDVEELRARSSALWLANYRDDGVVTDKLAASLWLSDQLEGHYDLSTLDTLAKDYYASAFAGEMGSEEYDQALRDWVSEQTGGLLEDAAGGLSMSPDTVLALAAAIYYSAQWEEDFDPELNAQGPFHAPDGDVTADYLHQDLLDNYYWGDGFGAAELRLANAGSMWFLLPDEGTSVDGLLTSGAAAEFLSADKSDWADQRFMEIALTLPKFDVSSDLDLTEGLKTLGVTDVFDGAAADFTPLSDLPGVFVSQAEHAARVTVDEEGVEAAAYTLMGVGMGGPEKDGRIEFTLDRPFLFAIASETGQLLFAGVVNHP